VLFAYNGQLVVVLNKESSLSLFKSWELNAFVHHFWDPNDAAAAANSEKGATFSHSSEILLRTLLIFFPLYYSYHPLYHVIITSYSC
jgi:hypothetical protein